jgi:hypothetical protein
MRCLGSMVRVVDLIMRRKLWANVTLKVHEHGIRTSPTYVARLKKEDLHPSELAWSQNCRLGHRGIPMHESH